MTYTHGISFGVVGESVNVQMRGGKIKKRGEMKAVVKTVVGYDCPQIDFLHSNLGKG